MTLFINHTLLHLPLLCSLLMEDMASTMSKSYGIHIDGTVDLDLLELLDEEFEGDDDVDDDKHDKFMEMLEAEIVGGGEEVRMEDLISLDDVDGGGRQCDAVGWPEMMEMDECGYVFGDYGCFYYVGVEGKGEEDIMNRDYYYILW